MISAVEKLKGISDTLPGGMARFLTLVAQSAAEGGQMFDLPKIGNVYYDQDWAAHTAYTISTKSGAVAVIRPDGILGHAVSLNEIDSLVSFSGVLHKSLVNSAPPSNSSQT